MRHLLNNSEYDCKALVDHFLVRPEGDDFLFARALIREGVYGSLLTARRQELHGRAADWFEGQDPVLRAQHLDRAEDSEAATAYLAAAVGQAAAYDYQRALSLVERGLSLTDDQCERSSLACLQADLLHDSGEIRASIEAYREAQGLALDDLQRCGAEIGLAAGLRMLDQYDEAFALLNRVEPAAKKNAFDLQLARLHHLRGNLHFPLGQIKRCWEQHDKALAAARAAASPEWEARALGGLADAEYARGRMLTAEGYLNRCLELCRRHGFGRIEVANISIQGGGGTRYYKGDLMGALEVSLEAEILARAVGHERAEILAQVGCFISLVAMAEMKQARTHIARAKELAERLGAQRFLARALQFEGRIELWEERPAAALGTFHEAMRISRKTGVHYAGPAILADIARTTDDGEERRAALQEGQHLLEGGCVSASYFEFYIGAIESSLRLGDWNDVDHFAAALEDYTRGEPLPLTDLFIARGRALAAVGRGNRDHETLSRLVRLRDRVAQMRLRTALPALDEAIGAVHATR